MKVIFFSFLLCFNILNSQNTGKVIYKISIDNSITPDSIKNNKFLNAIEDVAKKFELKLIFSEGKSFYELIKPMKMNSKEEALFSLAEIVFKSNNKFITSLEDKKITIQKDFGGDFFLIEKKLDTSDWRFLNEKMKIGNYTCYKAERVYSYESRKGTASKNQIVWYSPEIPIPFGPGEFSGFPGLVLSVKNGNIIYNAEIIDLKNKKNIKSVEPLKGKIVSEKEFTEIAKNAMTNFKRN
jgi:GLPGLI family protein